MAADFVSPHDAFVVIIDSAVVVAVAVKVALTLFAVDIVVVKIALLEEKAHPCSLDYPCHLFNQNFVAAVVVELVMIAHVDCCVVVPVAAAAATAVDCTAADFVDPPCCICCECVVERYDGVVRSRRGRPGGG